MAKVSAAPATLSYLGLGSNLGDRRANLERAVALLRHVAGIQVVRVSPIEETDPIGPAQPRYLNAVAAIETSLNPFELLDRIQEIEQQMGRVPTVHWGPRIIDIDVLIYGKETIRHPRLTVPHPQIAHRPFVVRELRAVGFNG